MAKYWWWWVWGLFFGGLMTGCGQKESGSPETYQQDFKTDVALLLLEWNGQPQAMASGFLASKEKGLFYTARHFSDEFGRLGPDSCRLFFNGRVYQAVLRKVASLQDVALVQIIGPFNPENFPDAPPLADKTVVLGEALMVEGFHPHPFWLRDKNGKAGIADTVVRIFSSFYGLQQKNPAKETEIVFDQLPGIVMGVSKKEAIESNRRHPWAKELQTMRAEASAFIAVKVVLEHAYSFQGLSGGPVKNGRGQIVGMVSAEPRRLEFDHEGFLRGEEVMVKVVYDTIFLTPMALVPELREYVKRY